MISPFSPGWSPCTSWIMVHAPYFCRGHSPCRAAGRQYGQMSGVLESTDAYRLCDALSLAVAAQLRHSGFDIKSDSPIAQTKYQRDFLGGLAFGSPPKHVALAPR